MVGERNPRNREKQSGYHSLAVLVVEGSKKATRTPSLERIFMGNPPNGSYQRLSKYGLNQITEGRQPKTQFF